MPDAAERLRALHRAPPIFIVPNAWDAASARVFEAEGFPAIATTSAGVAAALGYPDGGVVPAREMIEAVARIARAVNVPVTADIEHAYAATPDGGGRQRAARDCRRRGGHQPRRLRAGRDRSSSRCALQVDKITRDHQGGGESRRPRGDQRAHRRVPARDRRAGVAARRRRSSAATRFSRPAPTACSCPACATATPIARARPRHRRPDEHPRSRRHAVDRRSSKRSASRASASDPVRCARRSRWCATSPAS